jgi:hypothetical protein
MHQNGLSQIAMWVQKREPVTGGEVLRDEVKQQRAFAGSGLSNNIEVSAPFLSVERDCISRNSGTYE